MPKRVGVVTGGNTGVGLAIVRALCKQLCDDGIIFLTSRNESRGMEAVELLKKEGLSPRFHVLDVNDVASMEKLRDYIGAEHGGLDILVNNAGIAYKGNDTPMCEQAEGSINTNYLGVLHMTNTFLPLMRDGGRMVHVASLVAPMMYYKLSNDLQRRFKEVDTEQGVTDLMKEFVEATRKGDHVQQGWADWAYGASKLGVTTLTRIQGAAIAKDATKKGVLINCCCPGYVQSNMTAHHSAARVKEMITPDQAADTPVYLAVLPPETAGMQGKFLSKRKVKDFFNSDIRPITFN